MRLLTAFEHGWLGIGDGRDLQTGEADALAAVEHQLPAGCLEWRRQAVKFTQFCGVVQVESLQIEVLPKLFPHQTQAQQRGTLLNMLARAGDLEGMEAISAGLAINQTTLLDLFIRHFAQLLERQLQQGMLRDYCDIEDSLGQVRGRIDVVRQQRENLFKPQRMACRFSELVADIPINRLMHSALQLVGKLATSPLLQQHVRALRKRFAAVATLAPHEHAPEASDLNRMQRRYAGVVDLAHLFLSGQFLDPRSGRQPAFSLLFNMNQLFERYTASVLRPIARQRGLRLVEQGPRLYLAHDEAGRGRVLMRPDIALLDGDGRPVAILDTKWKRLETQDPLSGLSSADLYQMASYSSAYRCRKVALLYPEQNGLISARQHRLKVDSQFQANLVLQAIPIESKLGEPSRRALDVSLFSSSPAISEIQRQ